MTLVGLKVNQFCYVKVDASNFFTSSKVCLVVYRHAFVCYNTIRFTAEDKTTVHMITFIQADASEHTRPGFEFTVLFYHFIIYRLAFPFRMFMNRLRVEMLGRSSNSALKRKARRIARKTPLPMT